jgi:tetratricopeptide (TPR) repeat protein
MWKRLPRTMGQRALQYNPFSIAGAIRPLVQGIWSCALPLHFMTVSVPAINSQTLIADKLEPAHARAKGFARLMPALACKVWPMFMVLAVAALMASAPTLVRADELADVTRLYRTGQVDEASRRADDFLKNNPRDPRMRFFKGVLLMEHKQPAEAQTVFERLTQDYPELPEPYNNLAVLYAAQGDYSRARVALEMVVRTNPGYAVGYENLGDVHLKLASQAYANAQRLDTANVSVGPKLAAIKELLGPEPTAAASITTAPAVTATTAPAALPTSTPVAESKGTP